jgi:hypothetical protein
LYIFFYIDFTSDEDKNELINISGHRLIATLLLGGEGKSALPYVG